MGICAMFYIYVDLPLDVPSLVWQYSRHLCSIARGVNSAMGIYVLFFIYRSVKFGVLVFMASMLYWLGG